VALRSLADDRDALAAQIKNVLSEAAAGEPVNHAQAARYASQARALIAASQALAAAP